MIMVMGTLHISDAELASDPYAVLAKVEEGVEVIVERDHRPVATIKTPGRSGRPISACIAFAKASGSKVILDNGFGKDVEASESAANHGILPPGTDPRFERIIAAEQERQTVEDLLTSVAQAFERLRSPSRQ